jgi:hypothetical protein
MKPARKISRRRRTGAKFQRTKIFADGSALILNQLNHTVGIIETRPKYTAQRKLKTPGDMHSQEIIGHHHV